MKEKLNNIMEQASQEINNVTTYSDLEAVRVKYLGKKGLITGILRGMANLDANERPVIGRLANTVRNNIEDLISQKRQIIRNMEMEKRLKEETIDVTLPAKGGVLGGKHPLTLVLDEIKDIFIGMGFEIAEGPEVEYDYYNFEALNIPKDHPARDVQDTFYINENILLRTQTSPVQIRTMEKNRPPIRIIVPGRVYRSDEVDATHSPIFHQIEGLVVDRGITMGNLKGVLEVLARKLFGNNIETKFRPHHFPFTEPSAEMDVSCVVCGGEGCRVCSNTGWIEVLGAGMVHPKVLSICNIDPEVYSGFAFGMGLDRITMLKYEIDDVRLLFDNDIRFLQQF
ncbi:MAG TPA: phenylalanine--tRNA ligase subunit alpha [Clostridiales bacterium]|nr:phenylalanine--tRNA ligase subunit alpha [Clostridiales bacterium]